MLSLLVLFVLILIISQISYSVKTDARVARNEEAQIKMDLAIESVLLQVYEDLRADGEADGGGAGGPGGAAGALTGGGGGGDEQAPSDSREDEWARPQRTEMNDLRLRALVQDEESKFNVLSILTADEAEAEKAFERLVRVIQASRKGTRAEIDGGRARQMATAMLEFMNRRGDQRLPKPELLSDGENDDLGLPLTLRELVAIDPDLFPPDLFRDFRDEDDQVVHSLSSFLTVHSSLSTVDEERDAASRPADGGQAPTQPGAGEADAGDDEDDGGEEASDQEGDGGEEPQPGVPSPAVPGAPGAAGGSPGGKINLNTAPAAVLSALLDDRDVPYRFWENVIAYRNEAQDDEDDEHQDPPLDEYGEPIVQRKIFSSFDDLAEIDGWEELEPIQQGELRNLLDTRSNVFTIYVTARRPTGEERVRPSTRREDVEREETEGQGLVRTVRSVVWRRATAGTVEIVPLLRWEVVDYVPFEVLDYPDEER